MPRSSPRLRPDAAEPAATRAAGLRLDPLPAMVGYALRRAQIAVFRQFGRAFAEFEIRPAQLAVLTVVGNNPGLKQGEVATALAIKRANLVPLIDGLAGRGLLLRARADADRRSHALHLTGAGRDLLARLQRREVEFEARVTGTLGPDGRAQLLRLLAAVASACDGEEGEADDA